QIRHRTRREVPDVVHAHYWMSGLAALLAADGFSRVTGPRHVSPGSASPPMPTVSTSRSDDLSSWALAAFGSALVLSWVAVLDWVAVLSLTVAACAAQAWPAGPPARPG